MVGNASDCFKNGIILTSLSRNFVTDLRKASVDILKPQFASSISQSARDFFLHFLVKKKKLGEGTSIRRSKVTLLFSLTYSLDFIMLSPHNNRGVARGGPGVPVTPPLGRPFFEQTTYNIQVTKTQ